MHQCSKRVLESKASSESKAKSPRASASASARETKYEQLTVKVVETTEHELNLKPMRQGATFEERNKRAVREIEKKKNSLRDEKHGTDSKTDRVLI